MNADERETFETLGGGFSQDSAKLKSLAIKALDGKSISVDAATFAVSGDVHGSIKQVKEWTTKLGSPGYLVQQTNPTSVRVWASPASKNQDALLIRLLPFSHSFAKPVKGFELVYQSAWGGHLSIYRWRSEQR